MDKQQLIAAIHDAPGKFVIAATGGGSSATSALLGLPGASRTVIESTVPYDPASLAAYIGGTPDQACSGKTARSLAMASFQRAHRYEPDERIVFGIGCTAALTTDRERRGSDRCFVAIQSITETVEFELHLSRHHRDRASQEGACADLILHAMAHCCELDPPPFRLMDDERLERREQQGQPEWVELYRHTREYTSLGDRAPRVIFPGAFNPLHDGHRAIARLAEARTGGPVVLEVSAYNVDKPALDYIEMAAREQGIAHEFPLTFTNAPTFTIKASLFPGTLFAVGSDTLARIGEPRYYHDSHELRDIAIRSMADRGIRFLVFGRAENGCFTGLDEITVPPLLRQISDGVPESEFRVDVSSSEVRRGQ